MDDIIIDYTLDPDHRKCSLGQEPQIFHCHHYNNYLQRTILEDAEFLDSKPFLIGAAAEVSFSQLKQVFSELGINDTEARKKAARKIYQMNGFGILELSSLNDSGGTISTHSTHYSRTWDMKFGPSEYPVDLFTTGWLSGALSAIYDKKLGNYKSEQTKCLSMEGSNSSDFVLSEGNCNFDIFQSPKVGPLSKHNPIEIEASNVDYQGILDAVSGMKLLGDVQDGLISAIGVYLTRHYANYYNRISFEFLRRTEKDFGEKGRRVTEPLLIEAGHVCAFYTVGGVMVSQEWDALIKPSLKTKEDWVHGVVAVVNTFGWGRWQVTNVSEKGATFVIHDDYESIGYLATYGKSAYPISYLVKGGVQGILDLVYKANIEEKPVLDETFYSKLFKNNSNLYKSKVIKSRAMGDEYSQLEVYL